MGLWDVETQKSSSPNPALRGLQSRKPGRGASLAAEAQRWTSRLCFAAGAWRLKQLLSFALGGLLGNVFVHLLPEAWAYTCNISPGE